MVQWHNDSLFTRRGSPMYDDEDVAVILPTDIILEGSLRNSSVWVLSDVLTPERRLDLHCHNFWEISLCRKGCVDYLIGDIRYCVAPSDVIIVPPNVTHRPVSITGETPFERTLITLRPEVADFMQEGLPELRGSVISGEATAEMTDVRNLIERLQLEFDTMVPGWEGLMLCVGVQLFILLRRICSTLQNMDRNRQNIDFLDQVVNHMCLNAGSLTTSSEIAQYFHISDSHLRAIFRERYGISIHKFLVQQKLSLAKSLIVEGQPMSRICSMIGFHDYSSFYKAFKKQYGISPSEYKQLQNG